MKKHKKNNRETNINNTIKSILLSDREINNKNLKFSVLKEILLSDKKEELFFKKTSDFRSLVIYYKDKINEDLDLCSARVYFEELEQIRMDRINQLIESGKTNDFMLNKMKKLNKNLEVEENWRDRGYTHLQLTNGTIEAKIEDLTQLSYQIKMLELETINNITTSSLSLSLSDLEDWILEIKEYALKTYDSKPRLDRNILYVGKNEKQLEKYFIYYCLSNGKVYIIKRVKYF